MKNISLYLYTIFNGHLVGKDKDDNKYYKSNISHGIKKEKRWILYKKNDDPTNIDPDWHAWLHHIIDPSGFLISDLTFLKVIPL